MTNQVKHQQGPASEVELVGRAMSVVSKDARVTSEVGLTDAALSKALELSLQNT